MLTLYLWIQIGLWGFAFLATLFVVIDDATPRDELRFYSLAALALAAMTAWPVYLLVR